MAVTDYNKQKKLDVDSVSGTPTVDKATPILLSGETNSSFDVSTAIFTDSFDVSSQDSIQNTVVFSDSGDKMFTVGTLQNKVFEYSLSTSFDVSTASFTDSKDFSTQATIPDVPTGLAFSSSGDKMFVLGDDNTAVYEYSLSTSFDVSTASFTSSFDVSNQDTNLKALTFSSSGDKMYILGGDNTAVFEYSLSTNFDSDSASFTDSFDVSSQDTVPTGLAFSSSGDKMFVVGSNSNNVNEYSLSTSFDVSTASFTDSFDVSSQDTVPTGLAFSSSGDKMFVLGDDNDNVNEYSIGRSESRTGNGDIVIDFSNVSSESDLAVYDQNDSLLGYEIEDFDATNEEAVLWVYDSWVRDGSTQAKVVYGNGPSSSEEGSASDVWGNTGQSYQVITHSQVSSGNLIDSSPANNDMTLTGTTEVTGQFDIARNYDGTDDQAEGVDISPGTRTLSAWFKTSTNFSGNSGIIAAGGAKEGLLRFQSNNKLYGYAQDSGGFKSVISSSTLNDGNWHYAVLVINEGSQIELFVDENSQGTASIGTIQSDTKSFTIGIDTPSGNQHFTGDIDEGRINDVVESSDEINALYDASPKAGQVFFTQQAAESTVTVQTVSVPTSNGSATTVNPAVSPSGQATVNTVTSTATTQSLIPQVQPQTATVNAVTNTATTQSLNPQVTPQTATVQTPVSTGTGNSINPAVTGTGITSIQTSVNQAQAESVNPSVEPQTVTVATPVNTANTQSINPLVTTSLIVNVPTSTANTSNPEPGVNPTGQATVQTQVNQTTASNPEPSVSPGIVQVQTSVNQTQAESLKPEANATGTASIQTAVNNLIADSINPAINPTTITIQTSTNNATTESLTPQVTPGTARIQTNTNQVTGQSINPDLVLFRELDFEAPTKAIINKPNRFVTMQSRTFKTNDLGDELSATLKDENGALDLSQGVSSVTLLMRDLKGNKVLDQEVNITDGANGEIEYEWSSNDTPIQEPGAYQAEFEILDTRDNAETVPNDGFVTIETEDDING